jgi:hypothetical protein
MSWIKDFGIPAIFLIACTPLAAQAWSEDGMSGQYGQTGRSDSEQALRIAESNAMQALRGWKQGATTVQESAERLQSASRAFRTYREAECGLQLSLNPTASRATQDSDLNTCAYLLNQGRIDHLNTIVSDLPQR